MAHFAEIKQSNNEVVRVLVFSNEDINARGGDLSTEAEEWVATTPSSVDEPVYWKQTSYNNNFRKQYAGPGYTYDSVNNVFVRPKPYNSWTLNTNFDWIPPVQMIMPKPHPDWVADTTWNIYTAQTGYKSPIPFPTDVDYEVDGEVKGYDIRWDRNRSMWCSIKHDGTFWDWNTDTETWVSSSITEAPPIGSFYRVNWDEDNQKWTAVNNNDDSQNFEWNPSTQTWEVI